LDEQRFTEIFTAAARNRLPEYRFTIVAPLEINVTFGDLEHRVFLDNFWKESSGDADNRAETLDRFLLSLEESAYRANAANVAIDRNSLVPIVKDSLFLRSIQEQTGNQANLAAEELLGDLWIVYASDSDQQIRFLEWADIDAVGLSRDEVKTVALGNLQTLLPEISRHGDGPVYMLTCGGNYEASLILVSSIWESQAELVAGDLILGVPNRDMVVFTGADSITGVETLAELIDRSYREGAYPISNELMRWTGEDWAIYVR
jgi:uncharacterized protein YtpQ (UPF0354 family)